MVKRKYSLGAATVVLLGIGFAVVFHNRTNPTPESLSIAREISTSATRAASTSVPRRSLDGPKPQQVRKPAGAYTLSRRVTVPQGNAVAAFNRLRPHAEAGDAEAALAIYLKLLECKKALEEDLSEETIEMYEQMGAASSLLATSMAKLEDCEGVEKLSIDADQWLVQAAEAGVEEAQLLYAADPTPILGDAKDMLRDPVAVQRYRSKSMDYLTALATRGNVEGMLALARSFDSGVLTDRDISKSYAYYKAASLAFPGILSPDFIYSMSQKISPEDRAEAERMASAVHRQCCVEFKED